MVKIIKTSDKKSYTARRMLYLPTFIIKPARRRKWSYLLANNFGILRMYMYNALI